MVIRYLSPRFDVGLRCHELSEMVRGELRASAEDLHHRQGCVLAMLLWIDRDCRSVNSGLEKYKAETIELRWQVQELEKKSQLMTRFINAF